MGLIKAAIGALGGTLADQWKEYFYCDSMEVDVLAVRGTKRVSSRSSNRSGNDNVISDGSGIVVADGQCMMIVEQGKIVDFCAEPGEYTYNTGTEPSLFTGNLGESILDTFKEIGKRFTFGGDAGKDQRVYYFNTKELVDNKFGTPVPIPFRVVDSRIGFDVDVSIRCNGVYSYRITNPMLFYTNVCGNFATVYTRDELETQMKTEFISALAPAFARLSALELRPNAIPSYTKELTDAVNAELTQEWSSRRGISVVSVAMNPVTLTDEDAEMIKTAQRTAMMRDPSMAAATLVEAQAEAMKTAANNAGGAMTGFMGMNMASQSGGMNAGSLFEMAQQKQVNENSQDTWKCSCGSTASGKFCANCGEKKPEARVAGTWKCPKCGIMASGNFCAACGTPKPADADGWTCSCGTVNKGKFCANCGTKKPADAKIYKCDKCGFEPEDPANPPRFCPECGDPFNEADVQ